MIFYPHLILNGIIGCAKIFVLFEIGNYRTYAVGITCGQKTCSRTTAPLRRRCMLYIQYLFITNIHTCLLAISNVYLCSK
jgi:hypothetical protein